MHEKLIRLIPVSGFYFITLILVFMTLMPIVAYQPIGVQYAVFLSVIIVSVVSAAIGMVVSSVLGKEYVARKNISLNIRRNKKVKKSKAIRRR